MQLDINTDNKNSGFLDLNKQQLSDSDIPNIIKYLASHDDIFAIDLKNNNFTDYGLESLSDYIEKNTSITSFNYDKTTDEIEAKIQKMLETHQLSQDNNGLINSENLEMQQYFIEKIWEPFRDNLDQLVVATKAKTLKNYELANRMPSQKTILKLQQQNINLTKLWYGQDYGNFNLVYQYFYKMADAAHITMYRYEFINVKQTEDGYLSTVDLESRREYFNNYTKYIDEPYINQGGLINDAKSPIDDLNLNNVLSKTKADLYLTHDYIKQVILKLIQIEQEKIMGNHSYKKDSLAFKLLLQYDYQIIENYGQLPQEFKESLWQALQQLFNDEASSVFSDFNSFMLQDEATKSKQLAECFSDFAKTDITANRDFIKALAVLKGNLKIINREKMDEFNKMRYLVCSWQRQVDFITITDNSTKIVRKKNTLETSRIRINQMPYKKSHVLALVDSGNIEGYNDYATAKYNWNTPIDNTEHINNLQRDFEKVLANTWHINPKHPKDKLLPGECYVDCMQNLAISSTIPTTQHLHISITDFSSFKIFKWQNQPTFKHSINAIVDIVQLGKDNDAIMLKLETKTLLDLDFVNFISEFKLEYFKNFGGLDMVDLYFHVIPRITGDFVVIIIPSNKTCDGKNIEGIPINRTQTHPKIELIQKSGLQELQQHYDELKVTGAKDFILNTLNKLIN